MPRPPATKELDAARALERALRELRQTEAAFAKLCEELLKERRRSAQAMRCANAYRGLYHQARARLSASKTGDRTTGARQPRRIAPGAGTRGNQLATVTPLPVRPAG
jgi:hypothetical protein